MNHPGKSSAFANFMHTFSVLAVLVLMGCAGRTAPIELPVNHPANPEAPESAFTPPQNPFQTDVAAMAEEPETDSVMKHKMPESSARQHGGHSMEGDKESRSVPKTTMKPDHREGKDLRKEGNGQ